MCIVDVEEAYVPFGAGGGVKHGAPGPISHTRSLDDVWPVIIFK